jgi:putative acetyltransferase
MTESIHVRRCQPGEERSLFEIYFSAIHLVASHDYTAEQIQAWAPRNLDVVFWENKIREINPFVAELNGKLVGYADVQDNGYIDHFFVSGKHPRRTFFERFGFGVTEQRCPEIRGVVVPSALTCRSLQ